MISPLILKRISRLVVVITSVGIAVVFSQTPTPSSAAGASEACTSDLSSLPTLMAQAQQKGHVSVVVTFKTSTPFKVGTRSEINAQQSMVQQARATLLDDLKNYDATVKTGSNWVFPGIALYVDSIALQHLAASPLVNGIEPDLIYKIADTATDSVIGAPAAWNAGYTGQGQTVAILDTGIQENHPFFGGRVVPEVEACYSTNDPSSGFTSFCPNGQSSQTGAGSGVACPQPVKGCDHGTHVAGIAAGNGLNLSNVGYAGVALNANIMAVQIFSQVPDGFGGFAASALFSDVISGLNWVYTQSSNFNIAAVNMSLGVSGITYGTACDTATSNADAPMMKLAIDTLRSANIATVIASGDDGDPTGIEFPACISSAISVGATDNTDAIAAGTGNAFSDSGPNLLLLAPGYQVYSSVPYTGPYNPTTAYSAKSGTSMAAPEVAGAIAVLKSQKPTATVDQLLSVLQNSGKLITDSRNSVVTPRIQIDAADYSFVARHKTIGIYRGNKFYLRNSNTLGYADETIAFGQDGSADYPIAGDWKGDGIDRIGVYNTNNGLFLLCNAVDSIGCDGTTNTIALVLGIQGDQPFVGRWASRDTYNGVNPVTVAHDGVGVFRPSNGLIYVKSVLSTGYADFTMVLGIPGDVGIVGDWNGDGSDTPGVYRPSNSTFFLPNKLCNCATYADIQFVYGLPYNNPVIGNWTGTSNNPPSYNVGIGLFRPTDGFIYLRNTLTTGYADIPFVYGIAGDIPVSGHWLPSIPAIPHEGAPSVLVPGLGLPGNSLAATPIPRGITD